MQTTEQKLNAKQKQVAYYKNKYDSLKQADTVNNEIIVELQKQKKKINKDKQTLVNENRNLKTEITGLNSSIDFNKNVVDIANKQIKRQEHTIELMKTNGVSQEISFNRLFKKYQRSELFNNMMAVVLFCVALFFVYILLIA